jgi:hypothetical protein
MQGDQIGPKIVGLGPADMARLPHSIITKIFLIVYKRPNMSDGTTHSSNLPCFTMKIFCFIYPFS